MLRIDHPEVEDQLRLHQRDTGSADVQIAILTWRINHLTAHLRRHKKDHACRKGLIKLVSDRRRRLNYLKCTAFERYQNAKEKLQFKK